jgi:hypothetical protein
MADDVSEALEQLEAISREAEALATRVALDLTAATGTGLRDRVRLVRQRLAVSAGELARAAALGDDITDE